jgi:hypothetical protein
MGRGAWTPSEWSDILGVRMKVRGSAYAALLRGVSRRLRLRRYVHLADRNGLPQDPFWIVHI